MSCARRRCPMGRHGLRWGFDGRRFCRTSIIDLTTPRGGQPLFSSTDPDDPNGSWWNNQFTCRGDETDVEAWEFVVVLRSGASAGSAFGLPPAGRPVSAAPRKHNPPATANPHAAPEAAGFGVLTWAVPPTTATSASTVVGAAPKRAPVTHATSPSTTRKNCPAEIISRFM
jgi:hypothetical protein